MDYYLLTPENEQAGPYSLDQLRAMWASEQVTLETQYWRDGMDGWGTLQEIEGAFKPPISPPPYSPKPSIPNHTPKTHKPIWIVGYVGAGCLLACAILATGVIGLVIYCSALSDNNVALTAGSPPPRSTDAERVSAIYRASSQEEALNKANQFVVGTWTNTEVGQEWQKFVINEDGTLLWYTAQPNDDNWGPPVTKYWVASTAKYDDTGTRYYGLCLKNAASDSHTLIDLIIKEDGTMYSRLAGTVHKGDAFPFSK